MPKETKKTWGYRVIIEREPDLVDKGAYVESFSFRDVVFDNNGNVKSFGGDPVHAAGETLVDVLKDMEMMADGLHSDIIIVSNGEIVDTRPWMKEEKNMIKNFFSPKIPVEKRNLAQDAIDEIQTASEVKSKFEKMMMSGNGGGGSIGNQPSSGSVYKQQYTPAERNYILEDKKRDLQHEIDRARHVGDMEKEKALIHAYDKFRKDMEQQKQKERSDFEKYPFHYSSNVKISKADMKAGSIVKLRKQDLF